MGPNNTVRQGNGYGAIGHGSNGTITRDATEADALLPKDQTESSLTRFHKHMTGNIDRRWGDLILLLCCVITGLLDSSSIAMWGCFVSMQTGNTVYVGLGLADPYGSTRWIKSGTSIAFFCLGSMFFSFFHRTFGPVKRWVLATSFTLQMFMVVAAAVIAALPKAGAGELDWKVLVPVGILAFQSSGQAVSSRALKFNSLTSVVLTSIYCDLFADPKILAPFTEHAERNRRVGAPLLLVVGALIGGVFSHSEIGMTGALLTAIALKLVIVIAWLCWRSDPPKQNGSAQA